MKRELDAIVIGGGPAGQAAALRAAEAGRSVALVERGERRHGALPQGALKAAALALASSAPCADEREARVVALMARVDEVMRARRRDARLALERAGVTHLYGRAKLASSRDVDVIEPTGARARLRAGIVVIATGSRGHEANASIDRERVFDADSVHTLGWPPASLAVIGADAGAVEIASIFAAHGVRVCLIDAASGVFGALDPEIARAFARAFDRRGGELLREDAVSVQFDGVSRVIVSLEAGGVRAVEKVVRALARRADTEGLCLAAAGLSLSAAGVLEVDAVGRTSAPGVHAAGAVVGPCTPASAEEAGRRAIDAALGRPLAPIVEGPVEIASIPELAHVGFDEPHARRRGANVRVGRAPLPDGVLKLVCDGEEIVGAHAVGDGASEAVRAVHEAIAGRRSLGALFSAARAPALVEACRAVGAR